MPTKDINKRRASTRERVKRYRERQKAEELRRDETVVTPRPPSGAPSRVTPADIENLPLSIRAQINAITNQRRVLGLPDDLGDRQERAVRYFRGY